MTYDEDIEIEELENTLFQMYVKIFPKDSSDIIKELMELEIKNLMDEGKTRKQAILQILEHFETVTQQIKNYKEAIKKLAMLFAKGEISEETYKTSVQFLEKKLSDLKQAEKEHEFPENGIEQPLEPIVSKITATHIIVGIIVFIFILGAVFAAVYYNFGGLRKPDFNAFDLKVVGDTVIVYVQNIGNGDAHSVKVDVYGTKSEIFGTPPGYLGSSITLKVLRVNEIYKFVIDTGLSPYYYAGNYNGFTVNVTCAEGITQEFSFYYPPY
jgi:hypothetical protein